jgi:hypothetical protein
VEIHEGGDEPWQTPVLHHYSSGQVEFLLDANLVLHAYTPEDGLLWQVEIEAGLRDDFGAPAVTDAGRLYLVDAGGTLHAFDPGGTAWTYHPGGSLRAASDARVGPDGNVYYVSTSGTAGFLEAVSPDGDRLWQAALDTFRFYNPPALTGGGAYIRIADDFVNAQTGALALIEFPFEVDAFIEGADGGDYLRTGSHIIQWRIGPDGYEEVRSIAVDMEGSNAFIQPFITVYPTGDIEIQIFDPNGSRFIWIDGETGEITSAERPWNGIGFGTGDAGAEFVRCEQDPDAMALTCVKQVPGSIEPVWSLTIEGIDGSVAGVPPPIVYEAGRLYVIADGVNVYMFEVELP